MLLQQVVSILFTSASPWDQVMGSRVSPALVCRAVKPRTRSAVRFNCIQIEHAVCPNCTELDTTLPWVISTKPPKCEVDRINGSWDRRITYGQRFLSYSLSTLSCCECATDPVSSSGLFDTLWTNNEQELGAQLACFPGSSAELSS